MTVLCGMVFLLVGWTGVSTLVGLCALWVAETFALELPFPAVFSLAVCIGGLLGGLPFGVLGTKWAAHKWPPNRGMD